MLYFVLLRVHYSAIRDHCICVSENYEHQHGCDLQGHGDQSTTGEVQEGVGFKENQNIMFLLVKHITWYLRNDCASNCTLHFEQQRNSGLKIQCKHPYISSGCFQTGCLIYI